MAGKPSSTAPTADSWPAIRGEKTVKVWKAHTGQKSSPSRDTQGDVRSVGFSADVTRIVTGSNDNTVRVWDARSGRRRSPSRAHRRVTSVAFSADGKRIASGSWDQTVKVWNADTGREQFTLKGHTSGSIRVAFSGDGTRIVSRRWEWGAPNSTSATVGAFAVVDSFRILVRRHAADFARGGASAGIGGPPDSAAGGRPGSPACADGVDVPRRRSCHSSHSRFNALQTCSIVTSGFFPRSRCVCSATKVSISRQQYLVPHQPRVTPPLIVR